jgi:sporulation protein YlmC with PRC-barrel domain
MVETRIRAKGILKKAVISEETGRKFGIVGNVDFITESGELLNIIIDEATNHLKQLNLKSDEKGRYLIPFSAVKSIGDFVIVSENELV